MNLREARCLFSSLVAEKLCPKAKELGFEYSFGEGYQSLGKGHKEGSLHYFGCAQELNLYKNGVYQTKTEDHRELGEYWETVHPYCRWGGRFQDGNHYSFSPPELFGDMA